MKVVEARTCTVLEEASFYDWLGDSYISSHDVFENLGDL